MRIVWACYRGIISSLSRKEIAVELEVLGVLDVATRHL